MDVQGLIRVGVTCVGLVALMVPGSVWADGTVSGVVIDGLTGQPVRGATLAIEGTEISVASDLGGAFRTSAPAGSYTVIVTKVGFEAQRIAEVVVSDGEVADFAVVLLPQSGAAAGAAAGDQAPPEATISGEITITAEAARSTEAALLAERKGAAQISDSIGTEEMKKNTGSDAADVVKRVTGISLQNDKYVFVRGLGERYSNTSLNGSRIPSTEFEKKVVPLDLFPAGLLDKIRVSKSYTVDKPGDFAAGLVEMETLDFPVEQQASVGFSAGHHSIATGERFGEYAGGLGLSGSGGQPLPASIPSDPLVRTNPVTGEGFTPEELQTFGRAVATGTRWTADGGGARYPFADEAGNAPFDTGFNASYGNTFGRLGLVFSGTYSHDYRTRSEEQNFYRYSTSAPNHQVVQHFFDFDSSTESVKRGMVGNLAYRFSDNHHLKLRSMVSSLATAQTRLQEGYFEDYDAMIRDYGVDYKKQDVESFQLTGEHFFDVGSLGSLLEWRAAVSTAETGQDLRFSNYADRSGDGIYQLTDNAQSLFIYTNDLTDEIDDYAVDWTTFLSGDVFFGSIKAGVSYTTNDRSFDGRRLRFRPRSTSGIDLTQAPEDILIPENIRPDGFELEEITRPTDTYDAEHDITAVYAQLDWSYKRWRLIGGLRSEDSTIDVTTLNRQNPDEPPIVSTLDDSDLLPSLSLVYKLSDAQNLRLSASHTVNRPEFRELAPFRFTPAAGGFEIAGNPDLISATITSYDARWEWFPGPSDVVALSAFYKSFDNPIEPVLVSGAQRTQTYENAVGAANQGIELELRRNLGVWSEALESLTVVVNYSYIDSKISLEEGTIQTNLDRALVGQPDQVGNLVIEWSQPGWGSVVRLLYNYTGEKVAFAGTRGLDDIVEDPLGTFDLLYRQGFRLFDLDWTVKLSGENLTDKTYELSQGGEPWKVWAPGRRVGLSFGITFS